MTVSGVSGGNSLRRKPMGTGRRLQATVAVLAVVMLFASVLAIAQRSDFLESVAQVPTRDLVNPADTITSAEAALLEQLARVGDGITLEGTEGSGGSIDGRFMLAGPAFETDSGASFSVVTTSWMGEQFARATEPVLDGDRVLYERDGVTEWWVSNGRGYEQGWTVDAPPADGSTNLTLDVVFEGAATTQLSPTTIELILGDGSRAWYRNLHAFDAEGTVLPAFMTTSGSQITISVDAEGAVYPVTIDPILSQDQTLIPPDSSTGDGFGEAIATDGNLMIVSVRGADRNVADQGRVEVYEWNGTDYDFVDELIGPLAEDTDFGWDVDINETAGHAVVGAPGDDTNGTDAGAAHIFVDNNDGTWGFKQTVYQCDPTAGQCGETAPGGFDGGGFGTGVAISDQNSVLVGAPGADSGAGTAAVYDPVGAGSAWVTSTDRSIVDGGLAAGDAWGTSVDIVAVDGGDQYAAIGGAVVFGNLNPVIPNDTGFGHSVAFDEATDRVIVGSPFDDGAGNPEPGLVEVFQYLTATNSIEDLGGGVGADALAQPTDWPTATGNDNYGFSVAAAPSGNYVAGSPGWVQASPRRSPDAGRVTTAGPGLASAFTTVQVINASAHDKLGFAVAISGNRMAASAIGDDERQSQNGLVYTYERANENASWTLDQLIVDPTPTDDAKPFGHSLDMEGDFLAIGSPGGDGQVDVFELIGGVWTRIDRHASGAGKHR